MWPFSKKHPADPLVAFDAALEQLEHRLERVRQAAATLLSAREGLWRRRASVDSLMAETARKLKEAHAKADVDAVGALSKDHAELRRQLGETELELGRSEEDARALIGAAKKMTARQRELRAERDRARQQLILGAASQTLWLADSGWEALAPELDQARDEVERAHVLAQLLREK